MVVKKTMTAFSLAIALAAAPTFALAQSQATKTGSGTTTGVTAGAQEAGAGPNRPCRAHQLLRAKRHSIPVHRF